MRYGVWIFIVEWLVFLPSLEMSSRRSSEGEYPPRVSTCTRAQMTHFVSNHCTIFFIIKNSLFFFSRHFLGCCPRLSGAQETMGLFQAEVW